MLSLPPSPRMRSRPSVPVSVSLPVVPRITFPASPPPTRTVTRRSLLSAPAWSKASTTMSFTPGSAPDTYATRHSSLGATSALTVATPFSVSCPAPAV